MAEEWYRRVYRWRLTRIYSCAQREGHEGSHGNDQRKGADNCGGYCHVVKYALRRYRIFCRVSLSRGFRCLWGTPMPMEIDSQ